MEHPTKQPPRTQLNMRITEEVHKYISKYAADRGIRISGAIELIVRDHKQAQAGKESGK